jgi:hypothetical protein
VLVQATGTLVVSPGGSVLAYRNDERTCVPADMVRSLETRTHRALGGAVHDHVRTIFIDLGELEAGLADWVFPDRDGIHPLTTILRQAAFGAAQSLLGSWKRDAVTRDKGLVELQRTLERLQLTPLPPSVKIRVSEGYAYYGLHPETYAVAATRFAAEQRPSRTVCLGIRSIGTSLSAVVGAALDSAGVQVQLHTVRPHGHPFDRQLHLDGVLRDALRAAASDSHFAVVDEGPGLSGSSFTSVVRALGELGVAASRIALFPSWRADPAALRSDEARRVWSTTCAYTADAGAAGFGVDEIAGPGSVDFSGGAWRPHLLGDGSRAWPAVQPQHEVAKARVPDRGCIVRFAGLGRYGASKLERAERLAAGGFGVRPGALQSGYLTLPFVAGQPCTRATPDLVDRIADHIAFVVGAFPATRSPSVDELEHMTTTNIGLGLEGAPVPDLARFRGPLGDAPCAAIDGRMLPHEWIDTGSAGYWKVDALDHHADHFFPGIQDAAWDIAAAAFEFGLEPAAVDRLVTRYASASGDRGVRVRLPFYDLAYPAFRLGYATLARGSVQGTPDADRFDAVIARCVTRLRERVNLPSAP